MRCRNGRSRRARKSQNPQRTITVATMTFRGKDKMDGTQLAANCRIENLAAMLNDAGNKAGKDLIRREMERDSRAARGQPLDDEQPGPGPR